MNNFLQHLPYWSRTHKWNYWNLHLLPRHKIKKQLELYLRNPKRRIPIIQKEKLEKIINAVDLRAVSEPSSPVDEFRAFDNRLQHQSYNSMNTNNGNRGRFDMTVDWRRRDQDRGTVDTNSGSFRRNQSHSRNTNSFLYEGRSDNFLSGISGNWRSTNN